MSEELKPVGFIYRCGETIHFHRMQLDYFYSMDNGDTYVKGEPVYCRSLPANERVRDEQWQPMDTAPRDGSNILIRFGRDGVSQAKYVSGTPHPWKFIDTNDGITWLINHAVDNEYGPTDWMPLPAAPVRALIGKGE